MRVIINHEVKPIKNGYLATAQGVKLSAQGYNEEVARRNLERTVRLFLAPFEREGVLEKELHSLGLSVEETDGRELVISLDKLR